MKFTKDNFNRDMVDFFVLGSFPVVGAAAIIAIGKAVEKYGHSFIQIGPKSPLLLGVIGAIHNTVLLLVMSSLPYDYDKKYPIPVKIAMYNIIVGASLFAASALAAKVNLIASRLTLPGACLLIVTNSIVSSGLFYTADSFLE